MNNIPNDQEALFSPDEIEAIEFALNYAEGHNYTIAKEAYLAAARQYAGKEEEAFSKGWDKCNDGWLNKSFHDKDGYSDHQKFIEAKAQAMREYAAPPSPLPVEQVREPKSYCLNEEGTIFRCIEQCNYCKTTYPLEPAAEPPVKDIEDDGFTEIIDNATNEDWKAMWHEADKERVEYLEQLTAANNRISQLETAIHRYLSSYPSEV